MKKVWEKAAILIVALIVIGIVIIFSPNRSKLEEKKSVLIPEGSSVTDIAAILKEEDVISVRPSFLARVILSGEKGKLKYGEFEFEPNMSYDEVIAVLTKPIGGREVMTVSIPEGYSVEMIVKKLVSERLSSEEEFEKALLMDYDYEFLDSVEDGVNYKLQGFLFPSTYEFYTDATAEEIIEKMLSEFEKRYKAAGGKPEDVYDVIIKASLIEREAKLDSERPTIAGVIENRLEVGMPLQIDAGAQYVVSDGEFDVVVNREDLKVDSGYNTYKNKGLPIGPICNPGSSSIEAAINPEKHDYLYYRTTEKGDGSHRFSVTYDEHLG